MDGGDLMAEPATVEREMAPKRQRMMDMIMVLGGLKEESAIPLSRVNEELELLKEQMEPLTEELLAFPEKYFDEFLKTVEKAGLLENVSDRGILKESIDSLEEAVEREDVQALRGLCDLLRTRLDSLTKRPRQEDAEESIDLEEVLAPLPSLVEQITEVIDEYEQNAAEKAETAEQDLKDLREGMEQATELMMQDPDEALARLQKLGTKTRYGNFLRAAAQVKRAKREERIDQQRFEHLLQENIMMELYRGVVYFILTHMGSKTVVGLADLMGIEPSVVQKSIVSMIQRGDIEMVGLDGDAPVFARVFDTIPESTMVMKRTVQQLRSISKSLEGENKELVDSSLEQLENGLDRLQKIGQYNETELAEALGKTRVITDNATQGVLTGTDDTEAEDLRLLVSAGLEAFARFRLKIALEKGPNLVEGTNVYGEKLDPDKYKQIMDSYLNNELERGTMLILIRELGAMSAKDLAEKTGIPQDRVFRHLLRMKRDELLTLAGEEDGYVLYDVPRTPTKAEVTIRTASEQAQLLVTAKNEIESILQDLTAEDIGNLANSLETISKARDKMEKIDIGGAVIAENLLNTVEDKVKSAVVMAYRTRARIPSTRPKVTLDDLLDVDVPSVLEEYRSQMGYAPLLGFGTVKWEESKCLGCKSCEIACPEDAVTLKPVIDVPAFFEFSDEAIDNLPVNKGLFYRTIRGLASKKPVEKIVLEEDKPGFGTVEIDLWLCVACRTCVRRCPGPEDGALELELKWNLPEVVRQIRAGVL
ncbi:4Fe-4S dicluster domain-containing protein [Candidatus Thorarchaeota archaeon]|nr:MAG: 4Fe-4S dicluster domain-containing protein [Candidatus Thorarchaeota archaeon]